MKDTSAAIEDLQSELAFQADTLRELNDALGAQQKDILLLRRQLELLSKQLRDYRAAAETPGTKDDDEVPPHY